MVEECVALNPLKDPKRDRATTSGHRCAAQKGQYSAEMKRTSGLPSPAVDGNDVLAVHAAAGEAVRRALAATPDPR